MWCEPSDSSRSYGRGSHRARCSLFGETRMGRAPDQVRGRLFAGDSMCFGSLIWNDQTTLTEATASQPAKTPSRPSRVFQSFPK